MLTRTGIENIRSWSVLRVNSPARRRGDPSPSMSRLHQMNSDGSTPPSVILNCEQGDPTMFQAYWDVHKDEHVMVSSANETLSYFVESKKHQGGPWFVSADFDDAVRELHGTVGNAVTENRVIVVGTGSTQLFQAAMYALASRNGTSTPVVAQAPHYTGYPQTIDYLQSKLFHWAGDSTAFVPKDSDERFIEVVTSPNNPCGEIREGKLSSNYSSGVLVHDLAYYWPTYTPITKALDHDVMLFTMSKCSGHAGLRIGWAIVKNPEVAKKMAEFVVVSTIGTSQDAQFRAAGIMRAILKGYRVSQEVSDQRLQFFLRTVWSGFGWEKPGVRDDMLARQKFFHWGKAAMEHRWLRVRRALAANESFSVPAPPPPAVCTFLGLTSSPYPGFIWLKSEEKDSDCLEILKRNNIIGRGGVLFGVSAQYARVSLLGRDPDVDLLVKRLKNLK